MTPREKAQQLGPTLTFFCLRLSSGKKVFGRYDGYFPLPLEQGSAEEASYETRFNELYKPGYLSVDEMLELANLMESYKPLENFISAIEGGELQLVSIGADVPWKQSAPSAP